jgi:endonuclease/exonuclease/phosphatase family metal-dependent hydrolase
MRTATLRLRGTNDPRGIDVGILSKYPLGEVVSHRDDDFSKEGTTTPTYQYARDALEVHLTFNGRPIVLFGVHYKAKDNDDPDKRLAEAQHTRALADAITATSPGTGILILGDFNDTPGSPPYQATVGSGDDSYRNAAENVAQADRWTFDYQGSLELVDQQMGNPLLTERLVPTSVRILHEPEVDPASDHYPLIATYLIN